MLRRIQIVQQACRGQDDLGGFNPDKGFGIGIVFGQVGVNGSLQIGNRVEDAARMRWRVILEKKFSTPLSHEAEVGVKWKTQRGWRDSQAKTLGCLWVA